MRRFVECEVEDQVSLFFLPVLTGTTRRMVCTTCGEDLDVQPTPTAPPRAESQSSEAPKRPSDSEIEAQLAALKKKMGK
jgi:hypothetical protein